MCLESILQPETSRRFPERRTNKLNSIFFEKWYNYGIV